MMTQKRTEQQETVRFGQRRFKFCGQSHILTVSMALLNKDKKNTWVGSSAEDLRDSLARA